MPLNCPKNGERVRHTSKKWPESTGIGGRFEPEYTINLKGNSYRLREKVKAGLIREPEAEESLA